MYESVYPSKRCFALPGSLRQAVPQGSPPGIIWTAVRFRCSCCNLLASSSSTFFWRVARTSCNWALRSSSFLNPTHPHNQHGRAR